MSLLKNPMILIGIAGLGLVFGMPYLMDNSALPLLSSTLTVTSMPQPLSIFLPLPAAPPTQRITKK